MIQMSQRRRLIEGAAAVVGSLALASFGCEPQKCGAVGCLRGVNIHFEGTFQPGKTYAIQISELTPTPEVVPIMKCSLTGAAAGATPELLCSSAQMHATFATQVQIDDVVLHQLRIAISADGTPVGQQDYPVLYASREINGPGCGTCTTAGITVALPAAP